MSKFDDAIATYKGEMDNLGIKYNANLLQAVAKGLGPSIYNTDANKVSCSQQSEMDTVKKNFLIKKLGLSDGPALDSAINKVCDTMGSANRNKYRAIFYYLLAKNFNKESVYA